MRILDWITLDEAGRRTALARPALESRADVLRVVLEVIEQVRREGDAALRSLTERFDGVVLGALRVTAEEFRDAGRALTDAQLKALERAIANVQRFHLAQLPPGHVIETSPGVRCEEITRSIPAIGLYVPAGTAPLPSAVIMLAVPARIAGCRRRILVTPPRRDGTAHPAILTAAALCGIDSVFKVGGAQAIAALAYGTESIPRVDKIFGPGNAWVSAAKQAVANDPQGAVCDLPAGPSEVLVVADGTARPDFIAADLLAQAEHDPLSQAILVTESCTLAHAVAAEIDRQVTTLSRKAILTRSLWACRGIVVPDLLSAMEIVNAYAPEHLVLQLERPRQWLAYVQNAGSVFLGPWSPETLGDYCSGTNHVLPTDGRARAVSGLSVRDFLKTISVQEVSERGLTELGPTAITLAELEGLDAHAKAVERRLSAVTEMEHTSTEVGAPA